jgi:hypothetical protein
LIVLGEEGNGQFNHSSGVAIVSSERVYESDQSNNRIQEFRSVADVDGGASGEVVINLELLSKKGDFFKESPC